MRASGVVAVVSLVGCLVAAEPQVGSLTGPWSGTVGIVEYDVQLTEQGPALSGTGAIGPAAGSGAAFPTRLATVTGTFQTPRVQLVFASSVGTLATFTGVLVAPNVIEGTIQVDSTPPAALTLSRR